MSVFGRKPVPEPVYLNVYDLSPTNEYLFPFGLGVYHSGVQVHGKEWTFGSGTGSNTGVFNHDPKYIPNGRFRVSVLIGTVAATTAEVTRVIESFKQEWPGNSYHIMKRNCNCYSQELVYRLTGGSIPGWVNRLSYLGNQVSCLIPESALNGGQAPVSNTTNSNNSGSGGGSSSSSSGSSSGEANNGSSNSDGSRAGSVFRTGNGYNNSSYNNRGSTISSTTTTSSGGGQRLGTVASLNNNASSSSSSTATGNSLSNGNGTLYDSRPPTTTTTTRPILPSSSSSSSTAPSTTTTTTTTATATATTIPNRDLMLQATMRRLTSSVQAVESNNKAYGEDEHRRLTTAG